MLAQVCELRNEIATFLENKNINTTELFCNPEWVSKLAFLVDLMSHLNKSNYMRYGSIYLHLKQNCDSGNANWTKKIYVHFPTLEESKSISNTAFVTNTKFKN